MAVMVTSSSVGVLVCDLDEAALGEDVETKVAALLGPFVVLFGQDDADEPYQRGPIGGDADDVGAAADSIEPFLGIVGRDLPSRRLRERGEGQNVGSGGVEVLRDGGKPEHCCRLAQPRRALLRSGSGVRAWRPASLGSPAAPDAAPRPVGGPP
jgi:hypothetical protein